MLTISDSELNCLLDCGEGVIDRLSNQEDDGGEECYWTEELDNDGDDDEYNE